MSWRHQAACRDESPELFFGPNDSTGTTVDHPWEHRAIEVCDRCPVARGCLADALRCGANQYGVSGGRTAGQRRALIRDRHNTRAGAR